MNKSLLNISIKIDRATKTLFRDFNQIAGEISWFVVGATARDLLMHHVYEIKVERATSDVDMAVQMASWQQFREIKQKLLESGKFSRGSGEQRVVHKDGLPLDLVPFGNLETLDHMVEWPPDGNPRMSVIGYRDAMNAALQVRISDSPPLDISVAAPASVVFLKLIAWADDPGRRGRDADDLAYIFLNYLDLGNRERLLDENSDLTEDPDFDVNRAAVRLLGRDVANIASNQTLEKVLSILDREIKSGESSRLVGQMMKSMPSSYEDLGPISLLENLARGVRDTSSKDCPKD